MLIGRHYQNAYVTRDMARAIDRVRAAGEVRLESTWEGEQPVMTPDGPAVMHNKLAFLWIGDLQVELIEPVSGLPDLYAPGLPEAADGAVRFHHVCMRVPDWDVFKRSVAAQDLPVVMEGEAGPLRFLYLDGRERYGHYLEYTCMPEEMWLATGGR
jgi:hypothetical protein